MFSQRKYPNKTIRIPIATIRVRDIILRRSLKLEFSQIGLGDIDIIADNAIETQQIKRKEAIATRRILALCAKCTKMSTTHNRCLGRRVSRHDLLHDG